MENRIKIRHGTGIPSTQELQSYELGLANLKGLGLLCGNSGLSIQPFGSLWGTSAPEDFFEGVENIPNGTIYLHIKMRE